MVQRTALVIVLLFIVLTLQAQTDSLATALIPDSMELRVSFNDITDWIDNDLGDNPFTDEILPVEFMDIYGAAYHAVGLDQGTKSYDYHGFETIPGIFSRIYYLRNYLDFFDPEIRMNHLSLVNQSYTEPVLLTGVNAGLGEYDFNFVKIALRKNEILTYPGFYYAGDFLGQRGLWTGIDHRQSAQKQFVSIRLGKFGLDAEYATWATDAGSQDLLPVYWQTQNFVIDHQLSKLWGRLRTPLLDLSVLRTTEKAVATTEGLNSDSQITQIMAEKTLDLGNHHLTAGYEHAFTDLDYSSKPTMGGRLFEDKIRLNYHLRNSWMDAYFQAAQYDWQDESYNVDISFNAKSWKIGVFEDYAPQAVDYEYIDIYSPAQIFNGVHQLFTQNLGAYFEGKAGNQISFRTGISCPHQEIKTNIHRGSDNALIPDARIVYTGKQDKLSWSLDQYLAMNVIYSMPGVPFIRYQLRAEIVRDTGHDNAVFAGLAFRGNSDYDMINADETEIGDSSIWDVWAGLRISKLFDFTIAYKNILDSNIYGTYPIPSSFHASVRWVFVN
ncbi:MAG TPA: hypothetical protein PL124_02350 [Candidatus Cloacimonadota bacterium]|nr:hypothetical protein [Candidatus Cloacimonadota bacterium]HPS38234.1 hypothetical protein [Candidatus Cloacimonadota bacterium]